MASQKINIDDFLRSVDSELLADEDYQDFLMARRSGVKMPEPQAQKLSESLRQAQESYFRITQKMSVPDNLASLGEYLQLLRDREEIDTQTLATKLDIEPTLLLQLESNAVPIISIALQELWSIGVSVGLNVETYLGLLKKSHRLYKIAPKYKGAARYDARGHARLVKEQSMKSAFDELLLKGKADEEDNELTTHLRKLKTLLENT